VQSTLNAPAWAFFLRDYPDRKFVDTLIHIIHHGANIGFTGDRNSSQSCSNLTSAADHSDAVSSDIIKQVAASRTHGPFPSPPLPNFRSSPLGAVTRKRSTKIRRIHHLSWPQGSSVNDGIPDPEASIVYDTFLLATQDLIKSGQGSLMLKLDLEQAFRHIPVRPFDWPLLGFHWSNQFYHDVVLGFGLRSAPYIFNLFAEALHWIIESHIPAYLRHYLDDFLNIFPPCTSPDTVHAALEWALALGSLLGLRFQPEKVEGPSTCIEFLGIILDSIRMEARLGENKLSFLQELLASWSSRSHCTLRELEELTGFLQFVSQVIPYSRAFLRSLYDFQSSFHDNNFAQRRIARPAMRDLSWWSTVAIGWNGIHLIAPQRETLHIFTDASGTKGLGGVFGNQWFSARTPQRFRKRHIQVKEMYAVNYAILCWGEAFRGKHLVFHIDNTAVYEALNKTSTRSQDLMQLVRNFIALACHIDFTFSSVWLSSSENSLADAASRFQYARLFSLAPHLNKQPSLRRLQLGGMNASQISTKPRHSTFGMASHQAPDQHIGPDSNPSSNMPEHGASSTATAPSFPPAKML
jgi:hypothetical protein